MSSTGPILVLDARLAPARVGVWRDGSWLSLVESPGDPLDGLFAAAHQALSQVGLKLAGISTFAFNAGPGSALAIRTTAMALSTWKQLPGLENAKLLSFNSLQLLASLPPVAESAAVIAPARQGLWHLCQRDAGNPVPSSPTLVETAALAAFSPAHRIVLPMSKQWENPPEGWTPQVPSLENLRRLFDFPHLLAPVSEPVLLEPPPSDYKTWTGTRHR